MKELWIIPLETDGVKTLVEISYMNFYKDEVEQNDTNPSPKQLVIQSLNYMESMLKINTSYKQNGKN
jgi:hypothetical protein